MHRILYYSGCLGHLLNASKITDIRTIIILNPSADFSINTGVRHMVVIPVTHNNLYWLLFVLLIINIIKMKISHVGGQSEVLRPWQRSWGRRLDICKGGIEPQESPWKSSSIYPHNQSLPTLLLCAHLHLWLYGLLSPTTSFREGVNLELQLIIIPGRDKSVLTYKLLWRFSGLPDRLVQPHVIAHSLPTVRGTRCFKPSKNRFLRKVRKPLV